MWEEVSLGVQEVKKEASWWTGERVQQYLGMERGFVLEKMKDERRGHIGPASRLGRRCVVEDEGKSLGTS